MKNESKQHVQLPNALGDISYITAKDQLVYVVIKKFMNKDTKEAFPCLETIRQLTGIYIGGIRQCIENLERTGFIQVRKEGRQNIYKFLKWDEFEPFSFDFLERPDLNTNEKSFLVAAQRYMFKDNNVGKITLTNKELSNRIHMSESMVSRVTKSLTDKGFLTTTHLKIRDKQSGTLLTEKIFHLEELGQAIVFILKNHEDRITENSEEIEILKQKDKEKDRLIDSLFQKISELEKTTKLDYTL
jgi:predicted transcriptional regulator